MKIGIDARFAVHKRRGIGNYVLQLLRHLALADKENSYVLYTDAEDKEGVLPQQANFKVKSLSGFYPFFEQVLLPRAAAADRLDVLHCTGNTAPLFLAENIKLVLTLHDAAYMKSLAQLPLSPSLYQRLGRLYRRQVAPRAARRAAAVLTVSEFARQEILKHFQYLPPVSVLHLAPGENFKPLDRETVKGFLARQFNLVDKYFLAVGGVDPQKNTGRVVNAFLELKAQGRLDCGLVVVGVPGGAEALPSVHNPSGDVVFIDFAGPVDLARLYSCAEALLFPSLLESFGLPPLEAMACGTPVLGSATGAIPEITAGAALLVDPLEGEAIKTGMLRLCSEPGLRQALVKAGLERARDFSWAKLAAGTLETYRGVLA